MAILHHCSAASVVSLWLFILVTLDLSSDIVSGYNVQSTDRRKLLQKASFAMGAAFSPCLIMMQDAANAAEGVLSAKYCAGGVGEGCDDRAEGNEFIKSLQEKSKVNREANTRESLNAYYMKNYPDFFASLSPPRYLVKNPDGSFQTYSDVELSSLKKAGKIAMEVPKTMGGRTVDMTQKPMMVLKE